jgi:hypothetical protein
MSRRVGVVCAGVLILAAAGCLPDAFLATVGGPDPQQVVVAGTVPIVSVRVQEAVADAGLSVLSKLVGDDLRLAGMTKGGKVYCLHLRPIKVDGKDMTRIRIKWDKETDEEFWRTVVLPVAGQAESDAADK